MFRKISLILFIFRFIFFCDAQNQELPDSLEIKLKLAATASQKVDILCDIADFYTVNNIDLAEQNVQDALSIAEKSGYQKGVSKAYIVKYNIFYLKGDKVQSLNCLNKALTISEGIKDKVTAAKIYREIGNFYEVQNFTAKAVSKYLEVVKIQKELKDSKGLANSYISIGLINKDQSNYDVALKYLRQSLVLRLAIRDTFGIGNSYLNIATVYTQQLKYDSALIYLFKSLDVRKRAGIKNLISNVYYYIGKAYEAKLEYPEALDFYTKCLVIRIDTGDNFSLAEVKHSIGNLHMKMGEYDRAHEILMEALTLYEDINEPVLLAGIYFAIADVDLRQHRMQVYIENINKAKDIGMKSGKFDILRDYYARLTRYDSANGDFQSAFEHHKMFQRYHDSLLNSENSKTVTEQMLTFDFDNKLTEEKAAQEKKHAIQKLVRNILILTLVLSILIMVVFIRQKNKIKKARTASEIARKRSDELLLNILPEEVAEELKAKGSAAARQFDEVTVLFTDFKNFTQITEKMNPQELVLELNNFFAAFDNIITRLNIEKIKTIGDSYMCVGGLPTASASHAEDVVNAALEIQAFVENHNREKSAQGEEPLQIRIGIHSGPVVAGIVGVKKYAYDIWGDTVNTASRMESSGEPGKINISVATYEIVKNKFSCISRGKIIAKNKGPMEMYFVEGRI